MRAFVTVGERQMHYRRAGAGPAVVLLHESPLSSASLDWLIEALAPDFTVVALDTPGYGGSDPLSLAAPRIEDYADALADTIAALGLEGCAVYGRYTGAAIALEIARRHAQAVAMTVLEGLPLFVAAESDELLERYNPPFPPRADGSHLVSIWNRYRDQFLYFPWYRHELAARRRADMPSAQTLHDGVMDILRAGAGRGDGAAYGTSYDAAFLYRAGDALTAVRSPVTILAREDDVIAEQRSRMPERMPAVTVRPVGSGPGEVAAAIQELLDAHRAGRAAPAAPAPAGLAGAITRDYATTSRGQLLVRRAGGMGEGKRAAAPALVMLHASPGSGEMLAGLIVAMAREGRPVLALDTLGNGDSDKPTWESAEIADYARVVIEAADALELPRFDLYGSHTGALIAAELAISAPERVSRLILDGVTLFDDEQVADLLEHYTPPLKPSGDGTHLIFAWNFLRDQLLYWPWYRRTAEAVRLVEPASADELQRWLLELLKSGETYPLAYRAAFRYPTRERMPLLRTPTLMVAGAADMLLEGTAQAAQLAANATFARLPDERDEVVRLLSGFLDDPAA